MSHLGNTMITIKFKISCFGGFFSCMIHIELEEKNYILTKYLRINSLYPHNLSITLDFVPEYPHLNTNTLFQSSVDVLRLNKPGL